MTEDAVDRASGAGSRAAGSAEAIPSLFQQALWGSDGPPDDVVDRHGWGFPCANDDDHPKDVGLWGKSAPPIKQPVAIPPPNMLVSREEMQAIARGYSPMSMDDKWLAFMEGDRLFIHRSWTGYGQYEVKFAAKESGFVITSARIESDPERGRGDFDPENFDPIRERDDLRDLIVHVSGEPMGPCLPTIVSREPAIEVVLGDITDRGGRCHRQFGQQEAASRARRQRRDPSQGRFRAGGALREAGRLHCRNGDVVTPGFRLANEWVIHTVVPRWRDGTDGEVLLLGWCYQHLLERVPTKRGRRERCLSGARRG